MVNDRAFNINKLVEFDLDIDLLKMLLIFTGSSLV
jgi:hypothetical protein